MKCYILMMFMFSTNLFAQESRFKKTEQLFESGVNAALPQKTNSIQLNGYRIGSEDPDQVGVTSGELIGVSPTRVKWLVRLSYGRDHVECDLMNIGSEWSCGRVDIWAGSTYQTLRVTLRESRLEYQDTLLTGRRYKYWIFKIEVLSSNIFGGSPVVYLLFTKP